VTLVPFLELLLHSSDPEVRTPFSQLALPRDYLLGFALYEYWGRATHTATGAFAQERTLYVGALPLALSTCAVVVRPTLQRVAVAAFAGLMLAIVIGVPPLPDLAAHIPLVKTGNHLRLVIIMVLCLALLAGWGLDDLMARQVPRAGIVIGIAVGLLVLPVAVLAARGQLSSGLLGRAIEIAWGFDWPVPPADGDTLAAIRLAALITWLTFMGLGAALIVARLRLGLAVTAFAGLALLLTAGDLFKAGMGETPAITTEQAQQSSTPGLAYLQSRRPNRFVGLGRPLGPSPIPPNTAVTWALNDIRSYDQPVEERYDRLWRRAILEGGPTDNPTTNARLTAEALPAFRLLSVTDIAQDPAEPRVGDPRLPLAYDRRDVRVYANPRALPRVGVVDAQRVVPSDDAQLAAVLEPGFDGRRMVVTPNPLPGLRANPGPGPAGDARIVTYKPERVVVDVTSRRPAAELVLTDLHYPGWKVTLDGEPADLHRVDYLLRGASVPAGRHRVEFRYEPLSWRAGWILSLVTLVGLAIVVAGVLRRRRTAGP
jgi:hypothetical protein